MQTVKTDQTVQMPRLVGVFAGCLNHFVGFVMRWLNYYFSKFISVDIQLKIPCKSNILHEI